MGQKGVYGAGKNAILSDKDRAVIDLILQGVDKYEAFEKIYPEKVIGRNQKQISKSISDLLNKKKCKEYKAQMEKKAEEAMINAVEKRAVEISEGIMTKPELMLNYSNIARDENEKTSDRLKAMDSLAKYYFNLDKKQVDVNGELNQQIIFLDEFEDESGEDDDSETE